MNDLRTRTAGDICFILSLSPVIKFTLKDYATQSLYCQFAADRLGFWSCQFHVNRHNDG